MSPELYGARMTLTKDGVGVRRGGVPVVAAALRFRTGVTGASGFLNTFSDVDATTFCLLRPGWIAASFSAARFLLLVGSDMTIELDIGLDTTLVDRRKDIVKFTSIQMRPGQII